MYPDKLHPDKLHPDINLKQYTEKETSKATDIIRYCNGKHTRQEIQIFMDKVIKGLTDKERENIIEILETVCKKL